VETIEGLQVTHVLDASSGKIVEDKNFIASVDQCLSQVRSDESSSAGY
jgi:hypothetical protein